MPVEVLPVDPYNAVVREAFQNAHHAGAADRATAAWASGTAREAGGKVFLTVTAAVENGRIAAIRFLARGCPYLLAAAELACRELEGGTVAALRTVIADEMLNRLAAPRSKAGRLLLLDDALAALADRLQGAR